MTVQGWSCPRCGCTERRHFECNCGAVHDDTCANCGRFCSIADDEHVTLSGPDVRCERGPGPHEHTSEEKAELFKRWLDSLR